MLISFLCASTAAVAAPYSAPFWLPGGHLQTIFAATFANNPAVTYSRERWELPDGDFIDADWTELPDENDTKPVVVLFHGLEGNSQSAYATSLMVAVKNKGWRGVVVHFRGCSGEPNRLPRAYYAGETPEMEQLLSRVKQKAPLAPIYAAGVSLGANALLKWLGESGEHANSIVSKAAAVSAPMDLAASADALDAGLSRLLYTPRFVATLKPKALAMRTRFPELLNEKLNIDKINAAKTIHDVDNAVTAVLYGAANAEDYYAKNASKPWLTNITLPTLILNAKNDPFVPEKSLPSTTEVAKKVTLEYPDEGGHVGFSGRNDWLSTRLLEYFQAE